MNRGPRAPEVALVQLVRRREAAGEKAAPERRVGDEADPQLAAGRQDLGLRVARPERVLGLHGGDRMDGVRAADRVGRGLAEADVAHLALLDELAHRADRLLDRNVGVDAVLVVEVDVIGAQPLQRAVDRAAHVLGEPSSGPIVDMSPGVANPIRARTSSRSRIRRDGP